jgi:uncharacterized membrane protein YbhN (UPF0104 family)
MSKKYRVGFFIFGLAVLIVMVLQLDLKQVWTGLLSAGYWFFAVLALWGFLYIFSNATWFIIIKEINKRDGINTKINFWWLYKITVSAFALNYATPGGLMGGEPYRVMELAPEIGTERASSSVMLYVMTHIFSCFCFWAIGVVLYIIIMPLNFFMSMVLLAASTFILLGLLFFINGYRKGFAVKGMNILRHVPYVKRWARPFIERHKEQLNEIDRQVSSFHKESYKAFIIAILLEIIQYILSTFEVMFILWVIVPSVSFFYCYFILAFTSLVANLLFFFPLQLGGREGGFFLSITGLGLTASSAVFVALIVRIRELIWTGIGLLLINLAKKEKQKTTV